MHDVLTDGDLMTPRTSSVVRRDQAFVPYKPQVKLSVSVSIALGERLRALGYKHRLSGSSIIEVALQQFFAQGDDTRLGVLLRNNGATLRRR